MTAAGAAGDLSNPRDQQTKQQMDRDYVQLARKLVDQDLTAVRKEYLFSLPSSCLDGLAGLLKDPRDVPLALAFMNMLVLALPAAVLLHVFRVQSHAVGLAYVLLNYALFLQVWLCVFEPCMAVCLHVQCACTSPSQLRGTASERHAMVVDGSLPLLLCHPLAEVHADAALFGAQITVQIRCAELLLLVGLPSAPRGVTPCRCPAQLHQHQQTALTPSPQQPPDGRHPHWRPAHNNLLLQAGSTRSHPMCWPRCTAYRRARTACTT